MVMGENVGNVTCNFTGLWEISHGAPGWQHLNAIRADHQTTFGQMLRPLWRMILAVITLMGMHRFTPIWNVNLVNLPYYGSFIRGNLASWWFLLRITVYGCWEVAQMAVVRVQGLKVHRYFLSPIKKKLFLLLTISIKPKLINVP